MKSVEESTYIFIKKKLKCRKGFSLIEISVVLIIAGLLITASLKGVSLLYKAKLYNLQSQVKNIQMAVDAFKDKYRALPGDYSEAATNIDPTCKNGNGDGQVQGAPYRIDSEAGQFWVHLNKAELYTDSGEAVNGALGPKAGLPESSYGGSFTLHHNPHGLWGHWLQLSQAGATETGEGQALLTPEQASQIDHLMDTGNPQGGSVRAFDGSNTSGKCLVNGRYNLSHKEPACVIYIKLES